MQPQITHYQIYAHLPAPHYSDGVAGLVARAAARAGKELTEAEARAMAKFAARLAESGLSEARIERILVEGKFTNDVIDETLNSAFKVGTNGKLIVNPRLAAEMSDEAFEHGIRHELAELLKAELRAAGKIPSKAEIAAIINKLDMLPASKKELKELIEERLIADYLALKQGGAEGMRLWKAEAKDLIDKLKDFHELPKSQADIEKFLPELAYLKALNPADSVVRMQLDDIIKNLPLALRENFDKMLEISRKAIANV